MLTGAFGTLATAALVLGASTAIGAGVLVAAGERRLSPFAPALGLGLATVVAWWAVRLPGHGLTALLAILALAIAGATLGAQRLAGAGEAARAAAPICALAGLGGLIPFVVEGHLGVLGSGFNVDMSQHLFAADWIADPSGAAPGLYEQGYPLGPHALAVAGSEISGNIVTAFSGMTIALPVIVALSAHGALQGCGRARATIGAVLVGFAYLAASYFAQGSFKELFEACFLVGFTLWLRALTRSERPDGAAWRRGLPGAVLAAGALYAYSSPGLAWLAGTLAAWGAIELLRRREIAAALARRAVPALLAGSLLLVALAAPELDRLVDFGGSVGTVSGAEGSRPPERPAAPAARGEPAGAAAATPKFNDDLGNLFGQISPLEAFGVWPSGDFRVAPGDGAVPALVFYAGALLGAFAFALGVATAARCREGALLAALAAAVAIWVAAWIGSTPYTAAKALALLAPMTMLVALSGVLRGGVDGRARDAWDPLLAALAAAFTGAAALSSALALANAPVGPTDYTPGVRELSSGFAGRPTLLLAPDDVLADQHGSEFYGWEMREATPACVGPQSAAAPGKPPPPGFSDVITLNGAAPYADLRPVGSAEGVTLWRARPRGSPFGFLTDAGAAMECRTRINGRG